jgi:hypothetical protein
VLHTDDDYWPICDRCAAYQHYSRMLLDITEGRLEVPLDEDGQVVPFEEWER